jgi:hypothetical protein
MEIGYYVRCPIVLEDADRFFPRCFIMAQISSFDELSNIVQVEIYDLFGCKKYYKHAFSCTSFDANKVKRCAAPKGSQVIYNNKIGKIETFTRPVKGDDPHYYYLRLEDGSTVKANEKDIKFDFNQMDYHPVKQMIDFELHNPSWYASRLKVSKNIHIVKNAAYGFEFLTGCRTFLLTHQVITILRCMEGKIIRHMLADEVGLGKTIEACSIVKILTEEHRDIKALFIVPEALTTQWQNELFFKFNISAQINTTKSKVDFLILSLENIEKFDNQLSRNWDIIIVDEIHRLLVDDYRYNLILSLSKSTKNILLLSATPIQDRKTEYHKLLMLLNPSQYEKMPVEVFNELSEKQQSIQRKINIILKRMDNYQAYSKSIVNQLNGISIELKDSTLNKLLGNLSSESYLENKSDVECIIAYICENYRLERNIIRNRRGLLSHKLCTRELESIKYLPSSAYDGYNEEGTIQAVIEWLSHNNDGSLEYIQMTVQPILNALFSSPWALKNVMSQNGITDSNIKPKLTSWIEGARYEETNISRILDEEPDQIRGRILKAIDYIEQETAILEDESVKIVVFSCFTETAHHFKIACDNRWSSEFSAEFCNGMSVSDLENSIFEFQNNSKCRILICDELGGEGRNLQNAHMILHLDIPWSVHAIEQRIGRLDRLGRNIEMPVRSIAIYSEDSIEEQLYTIWKDGIKVFNESLSGLEIIMNDLNTLIMSAMRDNLYYGLGNSLEEILTITNEMKEKVEDEQLFDIASTLYRPLSLQVERMLHYYQSEEDEIYSEAMLIWGNQTGLRSHKNHDHGLLEFNEAEFSVNSAIKAMFTPPDWSSYERYPMVKRFGKILGTFNRQKAIEREDVLFFAPGDPIFDAIINNSLTNNRGRCCAFEVKGDYDYTGFVFTFNIEPDLIPLITNQINYQAMSQFRMYLPLTQIQVFVPLNNISKSVPESYLSELLNLHGKIRSSSHLGARKGYEDQNSSLEQFMRKLGATDWESLVTQAYKKAKSEVVEKVKEKSDLPLAKREMERLLNGFKAEALYFDKNLDNVEEVERTYKGLFEGLKKPKILVDSLSFLKVKKSNELS